jgi:hypothetical protein
MNILINDVLRIDGDYTVQRLHTKREGKEPGTSVWRDESFNGNLETALDNVLRRKLVTGPDEVRVRRTLTRLRAACRAVDEAAQGFISSREAAQIEGQVFGNLPADFWS